MKPNEAVFKCENLLIFKLELADKLKYKVINGVIKHFGCKLG